MRWWHCSCRRLKQRVTPLEDYEELQQATREFVHAQAVLTGDPVRAHKAGERLVELGVIEEDEAR